ncbi:MAG: head-tail connector protein, partial [Pseudomonadota bacterium]|nr:head-tail connector protein [Pseudomonadota bacterium]
VRLTAGFGPWDAVPPDLAQAVLMLAAHYYEYRDDTGLKAGCMPFGVTALIERHRQMRLGGIGASDGVAR